MPEREDESEQRVTPLELFFDLVFVFAITQVTGFLADHSTWDGLLRGLFLLGALWWAWAAYAWLTNTLNPEEGAVRIAVFGSMAAMLVVSLATPRAFGVDGIVFGVAYFVVRALHLVLYALAGRGDPELLGAVFRILPSALLGAALLVVAGFLDGAARLAVWGVALAIDYLWLIVVGMRGWRVSTEHFVERHGLIVIIAHRRVDRGDRRWRRRPAPRRADDHGRDPRNRRCLSAVVVVLRLGRLHRPGPIGRRDRRGASGARA